MVVIIIVIVLYIVIKFDSRNKEEFSVVRRGRTFDTLPRHHLMSATRFSCSLPVLEISV